MFLGASEKTVFCITKTPYFQVRAFLRIFFEKRFGIRLKFLYTLQCQMREVETPHFKDKNCEI